MSKCKKELSGIGEMIEMLQPDDVLEKESIISKSAGYVSEESEMV